MKRPLELAFSPCPNDTFIFHAMLHGLAPCPGIDPKPVLEDVETLNRAAEKGTYAITKLSFAALGRLGDAYGLLRSGAALGRGCGPLIVGRPGVDTSDIFRTPVAVPGLMTTARLLLGLYSKNAARVFPMPFDRIMPGLERGDFDIGVIIHESRFTYREYGLVELADLGRWWEEETGLPIPLGGIAVRRDVPPETAAGIERAIEDSVRYALRRPEASLSYTARHAQEMNPEVMRKHIELYVNDYSADIGETGEKAIRLLLDRGAAEGLLPRRGKSLFVRRSADVDPVRKRESQWETKS